MAQEVVLLGYPNRRNGKEAWLYGNAGLSYLRMLEDGLPGGWISDAGRTNAEQWELYEKYKRGELLATAAYPGTSKHETGRALDIKAGPAQDWMRKHGHKYGWMRDRVKNEPWHFEYEFPNDTQIGRGDPRKKEEVEELAFDEPAVLREGSAADRLFKYENSRVRDQLLGDAARAAYEITTARRSLERQNAQILALLAQKNEVTADQIAKALLPSLTEAVVRAVGTDLGMTQEQIEQAMDNSLREFFGNLPE